NGFLIEETESTCQATVGKKMELFPGVILVILWLPVDWVSSQKMEQSPQSLNIQEGEKAILTCNCTQFSPVVFQWYRQDPGRGLVFLLLIRENEGKKQIGRLMATFDKTIKQSSFYITEPQPADSATYLCAAD
ncbi:TVA2 protein, partial [Crocuta crocuta]